MSKTLEDMRRIGAKIRTQDNRMTDSPMFLVQQKVRDYGFAEGFADDYEWVSCTAEQIVQPRLAKRLEKIWYDGDRTCLDKKYYRVGYKDRWEFVTACFTESGCREYIHRNRHNLHRHVRIFADGTYRNTELRAVREFLLSLAPASEDESGCNN